MQKKLKFLTRNREPDGAVLLQNFIHDIEVLKIMICWDLSQKGGAEK